MDTASFAFSGIAVVRPSHFDYVASDLLYQRADLGDLGALLFVGRWQMQRARRLRYDTSSSLT
ncbi:hypothetical protein ACIGHN_00035 [Acidovorax sp. NPDC077693]|uniref:hypothetical protein n=1 Tax=unclassified Acidovorax TaxID=2684926 RepID=UPI0037C897E8